MNTAKQSAVIIIVSDTCWLQLYVSNCKQCIMTIHDTYNQWCSRKYLETGAVQNISMVLFLEREH